MKKKLLNIISIFLLLTMFSCGAKSGKVGDVNLNDITYFKDNRTNLCFAIIGAKKSIEI